MQYQKDGDTYIIYLEKGESIVAKLTQFCKDQSNNKRSNFWYKCNQRN